MVNPNKQKTPQTGSARIIGHSIREIPEKVIHGMGKKTVFSHRLLGMVHIRKDQDLKDSNARVPRTQNIECLVCHNYKNADETNYTIRNGELFWHCDKCQKLERAQIVAVYETENVDLSGAEQLMEKLQKDFPLWSPVDYEVKRPSDASSNRYWLEVKTIKTDENKNESIPNAIVLPTTE